MNIKYLASISNNLFARLHEIALQIPKSHPYYAVVQKLNDSLLEAKLRVPFSDVLDLIRELEQLEQKNWFRALYAQQLNKMSDSYGMAQKAAELLMLSDKGYSGILRGLMKRHKADGFVPYDEILVAVGTTVAARVAPRLGLSAFETLNWVQETFTYETERLFVISLLADRPACFRALDVVGVCLRFRDRRFGFDCGSYAVVVAQGRMGVGAQAVGESWLIGWF